jgi:hypothetical protein
MQGAPNCRFNSIGGTSDRFMSPYSDDCPASSIETPVGVTVPGNVLFDFRPPKCAVVFRPGPVLGASVPKAAVDEHSNLRKREGNVYCSTAIG